MNLTRLKFVSKNGLLTLAYHYIGADELLIVYLREAVGFYDNIFQGLLVLLIAHSNVS